MTGFEQDSLDIYDVVNGAIWISNVDPRSGIYHLRTTTAGNDRCRVDLTPLRAEVYVRVYAKTVTNTPAATSVWFMLVDGAGTNLLSITETGQVWLGSVTIGVNKGNAGSLTTSYAMWEIRLLVDNAVGLLDVRVDGVSIVSDSGIDTRLGIVDTVGFMWLGNVGAALQDSKDFDDVAVNTTTGVVSNSWAGPGAILARDPDNDGALSQWTPLGGGTHYDKVNAANDATYVYADTPGHIDLWEKPPMLSYGNYIVAIAWWLRAQRAAGAAEIIAEYRQLGTNWNLGSNIALTASWDYYGYFTSENPIFLGMLTRALLDASEFGVKSIS